MLAAGGEAESSQPELRSTFTKKKKKKPVETRIHKSSMDVRANIAACGTAHKRVAVCSGFLH